MATNNLKLILGEYPHVFPFDQIGIAPTMTMTATPIITISIIIVFDHQIICLIKIKIRRHLSSYVHNSTKDYAHGKLAY